MDKRLFFTITFLLVMGSVGYSLYHIFEPFLPSLIWASIIVVVFFPVYRKLLVYTHNHSDRAALLMCVGLTLLILMPATVLLVIVFQDVADSAHHLVISITKMSFDDVLKMPLVHSAMNFVSPYVDFKTFDLHGALVDTAKKFSQFILDRTSSFFQLFSGFFILIALVELNMFFLFRDGEKFLEFVKSLIPIAPEHKATLIGRMKEVVQASIYGTVVTACAQGFLGAIGFLIVGLPSAILWGVVMILMSFLPLFGPSLIWSPAAIYLFFTGHPYQALFLVLWGIGVVGMADNVLRPILIRSVSGEHSRLNTLVLFLSVLGGIQTFGFLGIVLGPLVVVFALTLIELGKIAFHFTETPQLVMVTTPAGLSVTAEVELSSEQPLILDLDPPISRGLVPEENGS